MPEDSITTLLVDDHEVTRIGLRIALGNSSQFSIVGEAGDGHTAVLKTKQLHPSLVIMDIGLPGMDGIEATKLIKESTASKVLIMTTHDSDEDILAGLSAGADAYCLKGISRTQLSIAIETVMADGMWLDPGIARQIVRLMKHKPLLLCDRPQRKQNNQFHLSEREIQVLTLLVDGLSNMQMADKLHLSPETIKTHMRHLMEKLRVSDRTQAAVKAVRENLVGLSVQ